MSLTPEEQAALSTVPSDRVRRFTLLSVNKWCVDLSIKRNPDDPVAALSDLDRRARREIAKQLREIADAITQKETR